jgi:uncharacterized membrane protein
MSPSNITLGLLVVAVGIYAIVCNKYPGKVVSYENAKKKYDTVNERRLAIFDGSFCIIYGVVYAFLETPFLVILLLAYYPVRIALLRFKFI